MRRIDWLVGALALIAGGASAVGFAGCSTNLNDCSNYPAVGCPGGSGGSTAASTSTTMSSTTTTGTTTTTASMTCSMSTGPGVQNCCGNPLTDAALVDDNCGVFVSASGSSNGAGTQGSPLSELSDAVLQAQTQGKSFIFVCAEQYNETSTISLTNSANVQIYGNLRNCKPGDGGTASDAGEDGGTPIWTMADATMEQNRVTIIGPGDAITLVLGGTAEIDFYGLNVNSSAATKLTDGNGLNGSSVAVYVKEATATFTNADIISGAAQAGALPTDGPTTPATSGTNGNDGDKACSAATVNGGAQVQTTCGAVSSVGGLGGIGTQSVGGSGSAGLPTAATTGTAGLGGSPCSGAGHGGGGAGGTPGQVGLGATATNFGVLTVVGFVGAAGEGGGAGAPGQGGGGGAGQAGSAALCSSPNTGGASGGSGGSGGCGGEPGGTGKGGGASLALVSDHATVTLKGVKLVAGAGGAGSRGGNPQLGGTGSLPGEGGSNGGTTLTEGCAGGAGGNGGPGGPGGGGRGGHSIAIASAGTPPTFDSTTLRNVASSAAPGGPGGNSNVAGNSGASGIAAVCWDFGKNLACP